MRALHQTTFAAATFLVISLLAVTGAASQADQVSAVETQSWLKHLGRSFDYTSMGKTGQLGPPAFEVGQEHQASGPQILVVSRSEQVALHGSDLYRLNCQGCHGETGLGAPPEIHSVINPVRATSAAAVLERMKSTGMDLSPAQAAEMAAEANKALLQRLHKGGQDMPAFPQLSEGEIHALVAYLRQLADLPGAQARQAEVHEPVLKVGEEIVKSTCNVCHDATGANPSPQQLLDGAIPPLSSLTARVTEKEFVTKVTHGAPVLMGDPTMLYRGRMPVFYYLKPEEAEDVYLYLTLYPPRQEPLRAAISSGPPPVQRASYEVPAHPVAAAMAATSHTPATADPEAKSRNDFLTFILLGAMSVFVVGLVGGGLTFTVHEFRKPRPGNSEGRGQQHKLQQGEKVDAELAAPKR